MITKKRQVKKDKTYQDYVFSIVIGVFLVLAFLFLVISNVRINQKRAGLFDKIEGLKQEIQDLSDKNQELEAGIRRAEEDDYWKGKLYEQGYVEPGEQAIVIVPPAEEVAEAEVKDKSFLEKIKGMLGF